MRPLLRCSALLTALSAASSWAQVPAGSEVAVTDSAYFATVGANADGEFLVA
jgi:hypothetical protein